MTATGRLIAQDDKDPLQEPLWGFRTSRWLPGEIVSDLYRSLPPDAAYLRAYLLDGKGRQGAAVGRAATVQIRPDGIPADATPVGARVRGRDHAGRLAGDRDLSDHPHALLAADGRPGP